MFFSIAMLDYQRVHTVLPCVSFVLPGLSKDAPNQLINHCLPEDNKLEYMRTDLLVMLASPKQTFWFNWVTTHIRMFACVYNHIHSIIHVCTVELYIIYRDTDILMYP